MDRIKGKLRSGQRAYVELKDGSVNVTVERGLIMKSLVVHMELPLSEITHVTLEKDSSQLSRNHHLTLVYGEGEEVVFSSTEEEPLGSLRSQIAADLERRRAEREREEAERRRVWEAHVHQISLMLDLMEEVFMMLEGLHGWVEWTDIGGHLVQLEHVPEEMREIGVLAPLKYDLQGLRTAVRRRLPGAIKEECLAVLTVLRQDVERLSKSDEPSMGFDLRLYEWFVGAYFLLWDIKLAEFLGGPVEKAEVIELNAFLERLNSLDVNGEAEAPRFPDLTEIEVLGPKIKDIRAAIQFRLHALLDGV
ncbi:hypothetical protein ES703_01682 [subsurface metagenome]